MFLSKERALLERQRDLLTEVTDLKLFKQMRADLLSELEVTKKAMRDSEQRHRLQLEELEKRFLAARDKLEQEAAARIARSRQVYKEEVGRELDVEGRFVRTENLRMAKELKFHGETSQHFQKACAKLTAELAELKVCLTLLFLPLVCMLLVQ